MWEFAKGAGISLVINMATVVGWSYLGPWIPSVVNVLTALLVLGIYGLEERYAFPMGYWSIQLLSILGWLVGIGGLLGMTGL